jgi:hypothetical protein
MEFTGSPCSVCQQSTFRAELLNSSTGSCAKAEFQTMERRKKREQ